MPKKGWELPNTIKMVSVGLYISREKTPDFFLTEKSINLWVTLGIN